MPLKSLDQISTLANYKKLVKADAAALKPTTGTKFQSFTKFTFADKTSSPAIFFNVKDATMLAALKKAGTGPASGIATVNPADEIVLNVANGNLVHASMAQALRSCGVARSLATEESVPEQPTKSVLGGSRGSTTGTGQPPQSTTTGTRKPSAPPPPSPDIKPQRTVSKTPTANGPKEPIPPPQQQMPKLPQTPVLNTPEKLFKARLASVKAKMSSVQLPTDANQAYQSALNKAKSGDFDGALKEVAIVDGAIGKAAFNQNREQKMKNRTARLDETFNAVKKSYFTQGSADRIAK